jgi:hypothetical protein
MIVSGNRVEPAKYYTNKNLGGTSGILLGAKNYEKPLDYVTLSCAPKVSTTNGRNGA